MSRIQKNVFERQFLSFLVYFIMSHHDTDLLMACLQMSFYCAPTPAYFVISSYLHLHFCGSHCTSLKEQARYEGVHKKVIVILAECGHLATYTLSSKSTQRMLLPSKDLRPTRFVNLVTWLQPTKCAQIVPADMLINDPCLSCSSPQNSVSRKHDNKLTSLILLQTVWRQSKPVRRTRHETCLQICRELAWLRMLDNVTLVKIE